MRTAHKIVRTIVGESREALSNEKYMVVHEREEKNAAEFIRYIFPDEDFFKVTAEQMLEEKLPACASLYDKQLHSMKNVLFGIEPTTGKEEFMKAIEEAVEDPQYWLNNEETKQFNHFVDKIKLLPHSPEIVGNCEE